MWNETREIKHARYATGVEKYKNISKARKLCKAVCELELIMIFYLDVDRRKRNKKNQTPDVNKINSPLQHSFQECSRLKIKAGMKKAKENFIEAQYTETED